uniref:Alcohol dehydrogenase n=1 Tax=Kalanchoe fedtschenkoi TaxID=63787 RepID=A0A7N0T0C7_KALFE
MCLTKCLNNWLTGGSYYAAAIARAAGEPLILTGSLFGHLKPKSDIPLLINRYKDQELNLDDFVTHEIDFEDINKAFDLLVGGRCIRCIIWIGKEDKCSTVPSAIS